MRFGRHRRGRPPLTMNVRVSLILHLGTPEKGQLEAEGPGCPLGISGLLVLLPRIPFSLLVVRFRCRRGVQWRMRRERLASAKSLASRHGFEKEAKDRWLSTPSGPRQPQEV